MSFVTDLPDPVPLPLEGPAALLPGLRARFKPRLEGLTLEILHDEVRVLAATCGIACTDIVQHANVGMIEARDRLRFTIEALFHFRILREVRRHDFDRDDAVQPGGLGFIHIRHAPGSD
jgi:hypothetical protein